MFKYTKGGGEKIRISEEFILDNDEDETAKIEQQKDAECLAPIERRVLTGCLDNLPALNSKVIRIFTSSTFTDTQVERNTLMEHVYPNLKEYCRQKHSLEFQVVDMRWGVTDEALDDHTTIDVCLNEIRNCQKVSIGPNFMLILGMKYGYRPVPRNIDVNEFEKLKDTLSGKFEDLSLLNTWYMKDTNAVPPVYVLLPISTHLTYFNKKNMHTLYERDQGEWWLILANLQRIFRKAANELLAAGELTTQQHHNYFMSVTEREIVTGILSTEEPSKCLVYLRDINNIAEVNSEQVRNFIDVCAEGRINPEPQTLRHHLKSRLENLKGDKLADDVFREYAIDWAKDKGVDPENNILHKQYVNDMTTHFESNMKRLIDESMNSRQIRMADHHVALVYDEALQHLHACQHHCRVFHGQEKTLAAVASYIQNGSDVPMVIHGRSGCGKTSIIAKAYSLVLASTTKREGTVSVIRFLGTTPNSSLIISLLKNLSKHIALIYEYDAKSDIPTELSLLIQHFNKMLSLATESKPLVLFLDSIDQLSAAYEAMLLQWIPATLPPHVKLVFSTLAVCEDNELLAVLQKRLQSPSNFVEVETLGQQQSVNILQAWLRDAGRQVTYEQQEEIERVLSLCSLPLFLRLVFDQICRWRSFELEFLSFAVLSSTIHDSIDALFARLENIYGRMFVAATFAYITLSKDGLSETELEDVLSLDDELLNSVYQYHRPPVRRIPPLLWTRLRAEIPNYLTEREADGLTVINWYHRQFEEAAKKKYLNNVNIVKSYHSTLSDYFLGAWADQPKPFRYTDEQRKMFSLELNEMESSADRLVPEQPLAFLDDGTISSYNLRKLSQLSHHLVRAERPDDMEKHVLLNFDWLHAKLTAMPLQSVFGDFVDSLAVFYDSEIQVILDSLRLAGSSLTQYPHLLGIQIIGRLLPYYHSHSKIKRLIDNCDTDGIRKNALVPANHCMHTPGGPLLYSLVGHPGVPFGIKVTSDKSYLISVSRICIIFDVLIGDVWRIIEPPIHGFMQGLVLSRDDKYAVCYTNPDSIIVVMYIATGLFRLLDNPLPNGDKLQGLRCDDDRILLWSAARWAVVDMTGRLDAEGDFLHGEFSVLEMYITSRPTKPIAKLEVRHRHGKQPSSYLLRHVGFGFDDFAFASCIAVSKDFTTLYVCTSEDVGNGAVNGTKSSRPARPSTAVVRYALNGKVWTKERTLGDTPHTVYVLTLSADETWLVASVEPGFVLWQTTEATSESIQLNMTKGKKNYSGARSMCVFSKDNEYLMAGCGTMIFVYSVKGRVLVKEISAHFDRMQDVVPVATARLNIAISSSSDKVIKIWNFDNITKPVPTPSQHDKEMESMTISGKCNMAVCVLRDSVGVWNIAKGTLDRTLDVTSCKTISAPPGMTVKMNCAVITNSGKYVIGADTQKMIFWETETGHVAHLHYFTPEDEKQALKHSKQLLLTDDDSRVFVILRTKPNFLKPDQPLRGLCVCMKIASREVAYETEFLCNNDCPTVLTSNNLYLVIPVHGAKSRFSRLGVWHVKVGIHLYDIDIDGLLASPIVDVVRQKHENSQVAVVDRDKASLVEINRKLWKKSASCVGSYLRWNGRCTSDGKYGVRRSPRGNSLQIFSLLTDAPVRTLCAGQHPGDIEGSVLLTNNDKHAVYHQTRANIIKVFRIGGDETANSSSGLAPEIAVWQPDARVCGIQDTTDGTKLVVGLSDGRMLVYVIADPEIRTNIKMLEECRRVGRHKASSGLMNHKNDVKPKSRWSQVMTIARITAKAKVATTSESKVCCVQ